MATSASAWEESTYSGTTEVLQLAIKEIVFQCFRIDVVKGPNRGASVTTAGPELTIGTAPGNDLRLSDPTVSGHHCAIRFTDKGFLLRDLASTNGTRIGALDIEVGYMHSGARLRLGATEIGFQILDQEVRAPLSEDPTFGPLFGRSSAMRRLFAIAPRIAASNSTVLIEGPTGTGKTLLAEALHQESPRASGPFVVIDCGAIPNRLIQSELYGHEKGAFTGATTQRLGAFEIAQGGTILLDEVGELPLEMQPALLRAIDSRTITRLGSARPIPIDVRIIAATNRDLRKAVNRGEFRADLFYRLNIIRLQMPSLDERARDIPELALLFYRDMTGDPSAQPPPELLDELRRSTWPGNLRELRSAVERAVLLGDAWATTGPSSVAEIDFHEAKGEATRSWEYEFLRRLMVGAHGNLSYAARQANMNRNHLRALLHRHGLYEREAKE